MLNREFLANLDEYIRSKRYRLVNAVAVYENGELAFERYYNNFGENGRNNLKSIWKSILSITLGICVDKGIIKSIDEPICHYLPQFNRNNDPLHKLITIRHLLTMSSGIHFIGGVHYHCPMFEQAARADDLLGYIADVAVTSRPGTKFVYKEWDVMLLSAVIGKACGSCAWDICSEYLYKPLGITSGKWPQNKNGIDYTVQDGEDESNLSAKDLAKIGLLFMNNGLWNEDRVISEKYIEMSISPSPANNGYGFLWWLSENGYHGRGFGGQELNIYPAKKIVAVILATATSSSKSYGDVCLNIAGLR